VLTQKAFQLHHQSLQQIHLLRLKFSFQVRKRSISFAFIKSVLIEALSIAFLAA
jgi:hypothetical protein